MRAIVYEAAIGGVLIVGLPLLSLSLEPAGPILPEEAQAAGLALALAGGGLWLWATVVLVARGRGTPLPLDPPLALVMSGPYRWIRNPMHVGLIAFFAGERELERRFDGSYRRYRGSVPAWMPGFRPTERG